MNNKPVITLCDKCIGNITFDMLVLGYVIVKPLCDDCKAKALEVIKREG